jgi:hypothetical protein
MFKKTTRLPKKTLDELMAYKAIITGKEALLKLKELEVQKKQFEESIEFEQRSRLSKLKTLSESK